MLSWTHFKTLSVDDISFQLIQGPNLKIEIALTTFSEKKKRTESIEHFLEKQCYFIKLDEAMKLSRKKLRITSIEIHGLLILTH